MSTPPVSAADVWGEGWGGNRLSKALWNASLFSENIGVEYQTVYLSVKNSGLCYVTSLK